MVKNSAGGWVKGKKLTLPIPPLEKGVRGIFLSLFPLMVSPWLRQSLRGNVEKNRQRRSRHFAVLTYYEYAPLVKMAAALLDEPSGKTQGMLF